MSTHQLISIFEEEKETKKKYGAWGIVSIAYLLLAQVIVLAVAVTIIVVVINNQKDFSLWLSISVRETLFQELIIQKLIVFVFMIAALLFSFPARRIAGWALTVTVFYTMLGISIYNLQEEAANHLGAVLPNCVVLLLSALCLGCINRKAARQFYKLKTGRKLFWWNVAAVIVSIAWLLLLHHKFDYIIGIPYRGYDRHF